MWTDRRVLHDQPLPCGHRDAVLRDEEERDGTNGRRESSTPAPLTLVQHVDESSQRPGRLGRLLRWDAGVLWLPMSSCSTQSRPPGPSRPPSLPSHPADVAGWDRRSAGLRRHAASKKAEIQKPASNGGVCSAAGRRCQETAGWGAVRQPRAVRHRPHRVASTSTETIDHDWWTGSSWYRSTYAVPTAAG